MKISDGIVFYTQDEVNEYLSTIKQKENRFIVGLNNGIDIKPIKKFRKEYNANLRKFEILFLGRISQKSNFNKLLEALSHPSLSKITLNVIGNDHEYSLNRHQSISKNGSGINWYGKLVNEQEISDVANRCRIFVYPGAVGLSLIHAMAYGLPCLVHSNRLQHMPEIAAFKTGITGLTFNFNDSDDLASRIFSMISNTVSLNNMSDNCLKIVENEFNTAKMAKKFINFVKELI